MSLLTEVQEELARMNLATSDLAADITELLEKLSSTPTPEEVAELKLALGDVATTLEATAAKYPAP